MLRLGFAYKCDALYCADQAFHPYAYAIRPDCKLRHHPYNIDMQHRLWLSGMKNRYIHAKQQPLEHHQLSGLIGCPVSACVRLTHVCHLALCTAGHLDALCPELTWAATATPAAPGVDHLQRASDHQAMASSAVVLWYAVGCGGGVRAPLGVSAIPGADGCSICSD